MHSVTASYAMRALCCLAAIPPGRALRGRDLADRCRVPASYLAKILLTLKRAGLVEATRGLGGGYRLGRPPGEVFLLEVVDLFDPHSARPGCLLGGGSQCSETAPCLAHERWRKVKDTYTGFLENTSLEQISSQAGAANWSAGREKA